MKTIAFVSGGLLPIPAVKGGAIETLLTILIEQNEKEKKARFVIVSTYDQEAERRSRKYQYTKIEYIKNKGFAEKIDRKFLWIFQRMLYKLFGNNLWNGILEADFYYMRSFFRVNKYNPEYIVAEGGAYHRMEAFKNRYGRDRMYLHIHHEIRPDQKLFDIYGNIIAVSDYVKKIYLDHNAMDTKAHVVLNAVDEERFLKVTSAEKQKELRGQMGFEEEDFVVLFCGRVIWEKGCLELLKVFNHIREEKIKLLFIGNIEHSMGGEKEYVEQVKSEIDQLGNRICVTGYVDNSELYQYYQSADCMVVPSLCNEAAGLVEIEGALSGCPIIATDVGGIAEYTDVNSAVLLQTDVSEERNEVSSRKLMEDLERAIMDMYFSPEKTKDMAECAGKFAVQKFSKKKMYQDFVKVFCEE